MEVLRAVEEVDAEDAVVEEEGEEEGAHGFHAEDVAWEEWGGGEPAFDVDCGTEEEEAEREERRYVRRPPAVGRVRAFRDGEDEQDEPGHSECCAGKVHRDVVFALRGAVVRDREEGCYCGDCSEGAADDEVPLPRDVLCDNARREDAAEETDDGTRPVEGEDEVFPWPGAVDAAHEHYPGGQVGGAAEALQCAAEVERKGAGAEGRDEGPEGEPG